MAADFTKEAFVAGVEATIGAKSSGGEKAFPSAGSDGVSGSGIDAMMGDQKIPYHKPSIKEGKPSVLLPKAVCENASLLWDDSLVGQFVRNPPNYNHILSTANLLWGRKGKVEVMSYGEGGFSFQIS